MSDDVDDECNDARKVAWHDASENPRDGGQTYHFDKATYYRQTKSW